MARLPRPRGPLTEELFAALRRPPERPVRLPAPAADAVPEADEDLQLALYCCYELHYRGFDEVDPGWEWAPGLLAARAALEEPFEAELLALAGPPRRAPEPAEIDADLRELIAADEGPALSRYVERDATPEQALE